MVNKLLLTGPPGIGKTTIIKSVCNELKSHHKVTLSGFYTEEVKEGRIRKGFDVVTVDGDRSILARKSELLPRATQKSSPSVGPYSVDLNSFEKVAIPSIEGKHTQLLVIDEIGKMEMHSKTFISVISKLFSQNDRVIIATIPQAKGKPLNLVDAISKQSDTSVIQVTKENRDNLVEEIKSIVLDLVK